MPGPGENFVATLAASARQSIADGYYNVDDSALPHRSLRAAIERHRGTAVITEIKFRSPSEGVLRSRTDVREIAKGYQRGGAAAISVLTEPRHFEGSIGSLTEVKRTVTIPVLMKDVVIDKVQIEAGKRSGADAILLMASIFARGLSELSLSQMIRHSHDRGLEVLIEAHTDAEYRTCLESGADLVGINNRNLETLEVSLDTSRRLLARHKHGMPVICESGISKRSEIIALSALGADGFLVGSAFMKSPDVEAAVRRLAGERV